MKIKKTVRVPLVLVACCNIIDFDLSPWDNCHHFEFVGGLVKYLFASGMSWAFAKVLLNFFILVCWSWLPAEWPPSFWKKMEIRSHHYSSLPPAISVHPLQMVINSSCDHASDFTFCKFRNVLCSIPILVWADEFSGLFSVYFSRKVVVSPVKYSNYVSLLFRNMLDS